MVVAMVGGCAGKLPPPDPRVGPVRLVHGAAAPAVDKLIDAVYARSFDVTQAQAQARDVLSAAPDSGAAHEVARYLAMLADDPHEIWFHFWKAAQDLDAPATTIYLWEMNLEPTRGEREASLGLYEALRAAHPDPSVRFAASIWEARTLRRLGRLAEARAIVQPLGLIADWQMIGAFDNDAGKGFLTALAPEKKIDLSATITGPLLPERWRVVPTTDLDVVSIDHLVWPAGAGVAYLATWVRAEREIDAQLRVSTPDPMRAWLNGGLVLSEEHVRQADIDNLIVPVHLHRGWNQLLLKSAKTSGSWWWLNARFSDGKGAPIPGLATSRVPQPFTAEPDSPRPAETQPPELGSIAPEGRRMLLEGRWLTRGGNYPAALETLRSVLTASPSNLLATYFVALAHWNNEEAGKAIDLLDEGVTRAVDTAPAFLHLRARYYLQRHLYDKAQADYIHEVTITPAARLAEQDLADLYGQRGWRAERCRELEASARKWPDAPLTVRDLGLCQLSLGYTEAGTATLERALAFEPGSWSILERLFEHARDDSRFPEALRWIGLLEALYPTRPGYVIDEADLLRRQGHPREAEQRLRAAIQMDPDWPRPRDLLGSLLWEQGRNEEALAEWKDALERDPTDTGLAQRLEFHQPTRLGFIEAYVPTDEDMDRALRRKVTPAPGAQRAWLLDHEVTEVNADGSARRVVTQITQALDEHGRDTMISQQIPPLAKILHAYSISKTGERQEASSIRGGRLRFRNLETGSRVVVQYIHYMPPGQFLENHFTSTWYFRSTDAQVEESRWVLVMPEGRVLRVHLDGPIQNEEKVVEGRRIRSYWMRNVPPLVGEPSQPPLGDLLWRADVSTLPDWDEYVRWERALLTDAFRGSPQLDELADRVTKGATTPPEKLDRLQRYIMKEVRYQQDYENTIAGVRPHAGPVVLERGYGDCKDKATLLIQLARRAGIKLQFAILRTVGAGKLIQDVPNQQFNHAIVYVPVQPGFAKPFFLDPTPDALDLGSLPPSDQGATSLVLDTETGTWQMIEIPFDDAERATTQVNLRVDIKSPTDAKAAGTFVTRGPTAMLIRHLLRDKSRSDKFFQALAGQFFQSAILANATPPAGEDIGVPVEIGIEMDVSRAIQERDGDYRLPVPTFDDLQSMVSLDRRALPLNIGISTRSGLSLEVTLPEGYVPKHLPADFTLTYSCLEIRRRTLAKGRTVTVTSEVRGTCHELTVADYQPFRDKVRDAVSRLHDEVTFGKAPPVAAGHKR